MSIRTVSGWLALGVTVLTAGCAAPEMSAVLPARDTTLRTTVPPGATLFWREAFEGPSLGWLSPSRHSPDQIAAIYRLERDQAGPFLRARHDGSCKGPAVHYGAAIEPPPALDRVAALRWRWRVRQHPGSAQDVWDDVAASLYVVVAQPALLRKGKGFKFGWLSRPGPTQQSWQRGLAQIELRSEPAGEPWRSEQVDVCALYRKLYGPCEGEHLEYVGVLTDADGTGSVAEADYAGFELDVVR